MKALLYYLVQVIVTSGILYAWYHFALRNKKFHRYNRFYLLAATVISITVPFLNIPVYFTQTEADSSIVLQTLTVISSGGSEVPVFAVTHQPQHINWFTWQNLSYSFYILIASIVLLKVIISLIKIRRIAKNNPVEQLDNIHFVNTDEPGTPFSFFRWLFWNRKIELRSEKGEQIFRHELFHIKQKHSWDIMYLELLTVVFWINPFFYLMKKEVKAIHEFLADQFAITENTKWQYAELLLMQAMNTNQRLVNPFFHNQIKRRIAMITTSKKPGYQYIRKLMVFPVAAIVIGLFAFSYKKSNDANLSDQNDDISGKVSIPDTTKSPYTDTIILNKTFASPKRKSPTAEQLRTWSNKKIYGVWLDGRRISNNELTNHQPSEFVLYNVSKLAKNVLNYGKHYYQVSLSTESYYKKSFPKDSFTMHMIHVVKDTTRPDANENNIVFDKVEIEPSFPGGDAKWRQYLENNLDASVPAKKHAPDGAYTVIVQFIVDKEGKISDIKSLTKHGYGMEEEAMRVIRLGPKWVPAIKNGHEVKAYKKQPITFVIGAKGSSTKFYDADNPQEVLKEVVVSSFENNNSIPPKFPGSDSAWRKYLEKNLDASVPLKNKAQNGTYTVVVQFVVDKDGNISDVKAITNHGYGMEEEVVRVIKSEPHWVSAMQNGNHVKGYKKQPVTFVVTDDPDNSAIIENKTSLFSEKDKKMIALDPSVLYIGVDNYITVTCSGVNKEDLIVSVSQGKITGANGKYYIRVFAVSEDVVLQVSTKDGKELGTQVFKARVIPSPPH